MMESFQTVEKPQTVGAIMVPAKKHGFSDFPKENNLFFASRQHILLKQNMRATNGRPYGSFFDTLK